MNNLRNQHAGPTNAARPPRRAPTPGISARKVINVTTRNLKKNARVVTATMLALAALAVGTPGSVADGCGPPVDVGATMFACLPPSDKAQVAATAAYLPSCDKNSQNHGVGVEAVFGAAGRARWQITTSITYVKTDGTNGTAANTYETLTMKDLEDGTYGSVGPADSTGNLGGNDFCGPYSSCTGSIEVLWWDGGKFVPVGPNNKASANCKLPLEPPHNL